MYEVIKFYTRIAFLYIEGYFSGVEALNTDLEIKCYFKRCFA